MSLDPLHEQLARVALALPEAGNAALAGGGAMLAHGLVDRPTRDLDLFTPDPGDVMRFADALVAAFTAVGAQVAPDRRDPGFVRIVVTLPGERAVAVEIAHDARIRDAVHLGFGPVLHPDEVAADKTLALFGRAAARDLVDVVRSVVAIPAGSCSLWQPRRTQGSTRGCSPTPFRQRLGMQTPHSRSSAWTPRPAGTCGAGQRHGVSNCSARRLRRAR